MPPKRDNVVEVALIDTSNRHKERSDTIRSDTTSRRSFLYLFRFTSRCDKLLIFVGIIVAIGTGAGLPLLSVLLGRIAQSFIDGQIVVGSSNGSVVSLNDASSSDFMADLNLYCLYYILLSGVQFVAAALQVICWLTVSENQTNKLRRAFFRALLRQDIAWFDENTSGDMAKNLFDDIERIREGSGDKFGLLLQFSIQCICGYTVAFYYNWKLTLIVMSLLPFLVLSGLFLSRLQALTATKEVGQYSKAGKIAQDAISCIRTVIAFNGENRECERYKSALKVGMKLGIRKAFYVGLGLCMFFAVDLCSFGVAFWFGTNMVNDGSIQPGTVIAVLFSVMFGSLALGQIGTHLAAVCSAQASASTLLDMIYRTPRIDSRAVVGLKPSSINGRLEFSDVEFSYQTRPDCQALNKVSFSIEPGETVAIVGASGCGKTTIVNLILRYYDANAGKITLDGINIADLNLNYLRNKIGVISQEPVLFDCSIEENILIGRDDLTEDEMIEACRLANANEFINRLPEGYETLVGEGGVQLSGGQKQRIAIARAIIRNPAILILDEATSALDAQNEAIVREALEKVAQMRTTLVIAHRLSTVRSAHKIIAIRDGTVAEVGTHDELMKLNGLYKELVESQLFENEIAPIEEVEGNSIDEPPLQMNEQATGTSAMIGKDIVKVLTEDLRAEGATESTLLQIIRHSKPEWGLLIIATIMCGIHGALNPVFAVLFVETLNTYTKSAADALHSARFWSLLFFALAAIKGTTVLGWAFLYGVAGERLTMRLRYSVFRNVLRQDISYFDQPSHSTGKICTRLAADVPHVKEAINYRLGSVVSATVSTAVGLALAFFFGWKMALLTSVVFPFIYLVQTMQERYESWRHKRDAEMFERAGKVAVEAVENIRTVQALTLEGTVYEMFRRFLERPHRTARRMALIQGFCYAVSVSSNFAVYAISFRFGAYLIADNQMEPMDVMRVIFATQYATGAIGWASAYLPELLKARSAAGLIFKMLHQRPRFDGLPLNQKNLPMEGNIEFDRVVFAYPSRKNVAVLNGLNLKVTAGKTVALVGQSGYGKSTIIRLIERFYDPTDGSILIDGEDLKSMDLSHVRRYIGLVNQEPVLFDSTIKENIAYGLEDEVVDDQKIIEAATLANIHAFISDLPAGYETRVGEKGIQLSGGQKQRVAIARALIRNPRILLLDEATSALDTENEKIVKEALDRARQGRTCIIVAHRLSTVVNADIIAVVKNGVIVEQGTHQELLALKGDYYALTQKQNLSK